MKIKKDYSISITIIVAICICLSIWLGGMLLTHWYANEYFKVSNLEDNKEALFGDSFGAVNALVSAFAFAGVIVAIVLQRKELRLQREDLELQREELKNTTLELKLQREQFEIQNRTLLLQRFENTFFQMLSLHQELVNNLYFTCKTKTKYEIPNEVFPNSKPEEKEVNEYKEVKGRDSFYFLYEKAILKFRGHEYDDGLRRLIYYVSEPNNNISFNDLYCNLKEPKLFDHYFRHLFGIINFVDLQIILNKEEKQQYVDMIRDTLSPYELIWIFYNSLSNNSIPNNKTLIEKYSLLSTYRQELLIHWGHRFNYSISAYLPEELITENQKEQYLSRSKEDIVILS
ncbi:putative phage abortive infection protein [Dysgonomonas sp. Marseille-P4677]|uniref:putative phage abortive infection protein n=1 Tax=Dysgonomonas sp. Marseille-P4677 TaxID=2364790 RepID=UPI0019118D71|nr:putative phage abortive infection protein [Dysgonomonas sp. Marseille-P4677]MBK5722084.1 putative phage abortive infection protein [Dysgonomonas sp. Marseille-P4677]